MTNIQGSIRVLGVNCSLSDLSLVPWDIAYGQVFILLKLVKKIWKKQVHITDITSTFN